MNIPKCLIFAYGGQCYRTAGYRIPKVDEEYISKDGGIKFAKIHQVFDSPRLIVRAFYPIEDFQKTGNI